MDLIQDSIGSKICGIQTDRTGAFTIAWEYSEDKFVSKTAYYTMKEGEVNFGDDYCHNGSASICCFKG